MFARKFLFTCVLCLCCTIASAQTLEIHHINVGQGDSTLIIGPSGTTMLIDGGDNGQGLHTVVEYLNQHNINTLDYMIATHNHADHIGGLDEVLASGIKVNKVYYNGSDAETVSFDDFFSSAQTYANSLQIIEPGKRFKLGSKAKATCIYVNGKAENETMFVSKENDKSICLLVEFDDFQYFIGGDIGGGANNYANVEKFVAPYVGDVDVLRVNHHGSSSSTNNYFLQMLKPEVAIISVGENSYGHPTTEVMDRLYGKNADIYRTGVGSYSGGKALSHTVIKVKKGKKYFVNGIRKIKDEYIPKDNAVPEAQFSNSNDGLLASFNASSCRDDKKVKTYFWDLGDGNIRHGTKYRTINHAYSTPGSYIVTLVCADKYGCSDTLIKTVTVDKKRSLSVSAYASPSNPKQYSHVKIYVTVKDQDGKAINGASVKTVAHYKSTDTTKYGFTDSTVKAVMDYYISRATKYYSVSVSVSVSYGGMSAYTSTSFTPK